VITAYPSQEPRFTSVLNGVIVPYLFKTEEIWNKDPIKNWGEPGFL
jgi:hypothetical protein